MDLTPREIVLRVQTTVVKARSIAAENGTLEVGIELQPRLLGTTDPLSLFVMTERMLAGGRDVQPGDAFNLLSMAERVETFPETYAIINGADMPRALDALRPAQPTKTA